MTHHVSWAVYNRAAKARKRSSSIAANRAYWRDIRWQSMVNADTALLGRTPDYVALLQKHPETEPELPATSPVSFRDAARIA